MTQNNIDMTIMKKISKGKIALFVIFLGVYAQGCAFERENRRIAEKDEVQKAFSWWPTDAKPEPVKDTQRGGYWWWPKEAGKVGPLWGNRGYCYVDKVIFDYKEEELPPPKPKELRPSLLIKKIIKNVKIYFDYNKTEIRDDAIPILEAAVRALNKNPETDILITGNCDTRGSEAYNEKLGRHRSEAVKKFMVRQGIDETRIKIVSRGKLDAVAPITDIVGMQKDRNAQFMVAEVEEVMLPYEGKAAESLTPLEAKSPEITLEGARPIEEGKLVEEKEEVVESQPKVSTKEYTIKKGDTLWKIAKKELGSGHRWKYLYEINKDRMKDPNKLKAGKKIIIPIE